MAAAAAPASVPEKGDPADAVVVYLLPVRIGAAINASPFSAKLLAFLRMAGVE
jgi:hypothetical protein